MGPGKLLALLSTYCTLALKVPAIEIKSRHLQYFGKYARFVADEHDDHVLAGVLTSVIEPRCEVIECLAAI